jgi:hypothetical protein
MESVFISHASDDADFADQLAADLQKHGYLTQTMDDLLPEGALLPTDRLDDRLSIAIEQHNYFIPVLTPSAISSNWVLKEIETALSHETQLGNVTILPVLRRRCVLPEVLGVRSPSDFTGSYTRGLRALLDKMLAFRLPAGERTPHVTGALLASEYIAQQLFYVLLPLRDELQGLTPRAFEELIAESLRGLGYQVELTQFTRDGGIDLIAIGGRDSQHKPILLQCKRYSPGKRVGVEVVKSLIYSTTPDLHKPVLVSTSSFIDQADWTNKRRLKRLTRCRWELNESDLVRVYWWIASTPELDQEITKPVTEARDRYSSLIDRKFQGLLSKDEEAELGRLEALLDKAEAPFYAPIKQKLITARDKLSSKSHRNKEN